MIARLVYISIVCIVLSIIAIGIHKKAYQAVAPPIYDPISYYSKSQIVWDAISHHQWKSAFDQFPQRPPGTALILYPFGFVHSIQSFLFRSTFTPIAIWALALMIIILPNLKDFKGMIVGCGLTVGLLSLPIFYHFEVPIDSRKLFGMSLQWGLVDVLQGSITAVSLALLYNGVKTNIRSLIILGWLAGAYTIFIKPSGVLVMGCLFPVFIIESIISWRKKNIEIWKNIIANLAIGVGIAGIAGFLAIYSGYLSKEIVQAAVIGQKLVIQIAHQPIHTQLKLFIGPVFGYWWFCLIAITTLVLLVTLIRSICNRRFSELALRCATSLTILFAALYWWVNIAGEEHRYLFPFIMITMTWLIIPTLFEWMISLNNKAISLVIVYCLLPVIPIITLLSIQQGMASSKIEKLCGYNLDSGQYLEGVNMGHFLIKESMKIQRPISIYSIGGWYVGAVEMIDWVNSIESLREPKHFTIYRVNDWIHPGIKFKQVLSCDYFIIQKSQLDEVPSVPNDARSWQDEEAQLAQFIKYCASKPHSGISLIQEGPVLLYKVEDRAKYVAACNDWVAGHKWSDDFWVRNSYSRGDFDAAGLKVLDLHSSQELISTHVSLLPEVDFGQKIRLLAVWRKNREAIDKKSQTPTLTKGDDSLTFLFRADQEISSKYTIFIHLMDKDKKVIFQHDFEIDPEGGIISQGTLWKSLVPIPKSELTKSVFLGFGAYIPNKAGSFLQSNYNDSDWNGSRVLMRLNP